jgi:hypothetical protein
MAPEWKNASLGEDQGNRQFRLGVLVGGIGTILSGVIVALIVNLLVPVLKERFWPPPPPRPVQLEEIRHDVASSGGQTLFSREVDLHGSNAKSQVLALATRSGGTELWILDEEDGRLRSEFRFRPGGLAPLSGTRSGRYKMEVAEISDLDEDGAEEIVLLLLPRWRLKEGGERAAWRHGAVGLLGPGRPDLQIPVLVRWNHGEDRYGLQPLITQKPGLSVVPLGGPGERKRAAFYRRPYQLTDPESGTRWQAYGAQVSQVLRNRLGQPFLLNAHPIRWGVQMAGPYGFGYRPAPRCGTARLPGGRVIPAPCAYEIPLPPATPRLAPDVLSLTAGRIDTAGRVLVRSCTGDDTFFVKTGLNAAHAVKRAWRRLLLRSAC